MTKKAGALYLITTPIGNLEDITLRALRYLKSLPVFFAEDTREFKNLLKALSIENEKKIFSYAAHNMKAATESVLSFLAEGADVGLSSDRGTPGISDPGAYLVRRAKDEGFSVVPIPGVSSLSTAISISGKEEYPIHFWGFVEAKERKKIFEQTKKEKGIHYFFESPKRVKDFILDFSKFFPGEKIFFAKELTKLFERAEWADPEIILSDPALEKGEFVLAYEIKEIAALPSSADVLLEKIRFRLSSEKDWAKEMSRQLGVPSKDIYNQLQEFKKSSLNL